MKKQILIVGLGRLGATLASALSNTGHEVLAIDTDEKNVHSVATKVTQAVQADGTNEATLRELGAGNFDIAIVTIGGEVENSVLATILLKRLGVPYVIARANSELHGTILDKIGADRVVYPEHDIGLRIAHEIEMGSVTDYVPVSEGYGVAKIVTPSYLDGKRLSELGFKVSGKGDLAVLLIQHGNEVTISPELQETVKAGDILVVSGSTESLGRILSSMRSESGK